MDHESTSDDGQRSSPIDASVSDQPPAGPGELSTRGRYIVLVMAFLGWMCAGVEMSVFPLATGPIIQHFYGGQQDAADAGSGKRPATASKDVDRDALKTITGKWFTWYISAFLLGAAAGGLIFGWLGDKKGRVMAMGLSILCYSLVTGLCYFARSPWELLVLRLVACMGIGGMWPSGVALVSEAWPNVSRPMLAGLIGTSANVGITILGLISRQVAITPDSWRWVMLLGASPALLGIVALLIVPESPRWLATGRNESRSKASAPIAEVFRPPLLWRTLAGICLGAVPLLGAWGSQKWMLLWAESVGGPAGDYTLKADTQSIWGVGAALGSLMGGYLASRLGRRTTYFAVSIGSLAISAWLFRFLEPSRNFDFMATIFALGLVATVYFGWLPFYLPELFPTRVRATGTGVSFNFGRIGSAIAILASGALVEAYQGHYERIGATTSLIYAAGMVVILLAPKTTGDTLED